MRVGNDGDAKLTAIKCPATGQWTTGTAIGIPKKLRSPARTPPACSGKFQQWNVEIGCRARSKQRGPGHRGGYTQSHEDSSMLPAGINTSR